ncbi:MAG: aminoacyl-tRNA hydrolase [Bacteroidales bacterium]|nr:aminoacyl-tRNA hydrolase [Bacteroidales bacterium]
MSLPLPITERPLDSEYFFLTARSGGPGGQHVNKTETKVELRFHVNSSAWLSDSEKIVINRKLKNNINKEGYLQVVAQEHRSQIKNKKEAVQRLYSLLSYALQKRKKRIPTKPGRGAVEKRIEGKKKISGKKESRKKPDWE